MVCCVSSGWLARSASCSCDRNASKIPAGLSAGVLTASATLAVLVPCKNTEHPESEGVPELDTVTNNLISGYNKTLQNLIGQKNEFCFFEIITNQSTFDTCIIIYVTCMWDACTWLYHTWMVNDDTTVCLSVWNTWFDIRTPAMDASGCSHTTVYIGEL